MTFPVKTRTCTAFALASLAFFGLSACGSNSASSTSTATTSSSATASASASASAHSSASVSARASTSAGASTSANASTSVSAAATASATAQSSATTSPSISQPTASATVSEGPAIDLAAGSAQYLQNQSLVQNAAAAVQNVTLAPLPSATASEGAQASSAADVTQAKLSDESTQQILALATGSAAVDFQTQAIEYAQKDWVVTGKPTFTGTPTVSETTYQGAPAQKLAVCVDTSQVSVKNKAGQNMLPDSAPQHTMTYYTLIQEAGVWKIASVDFPDNADC